MKLTTPEAISEYLHDAEIELSTVKAFPSISFKGTLYGTAKNRKGKILPAKYFFKATCEGATDISIKDPEGVGWLSLCDAKYFTDRSLLTLVGCVPGSINITAAQICTWSSKTIIR